MLIDAAALRARLDDIADAHAGNAEAMRAAVLEHCKEMLAAARAEAERALFDHGSGLRTMRSLAAFHDELIGALADLTVARVYRIGNRSDAEHLAIVAVGGYGRGTLAPFSDIDLLFLHPYKLTAWGESVIEFLLYLLWDTGLKVGHAARNVDQCMRYAANDYTIRTALLESRWLWGEASLFESLRQRFDKEIVARRADAYVAAKLAERDERHRRAGESRYLVEPNVKEGKGGLRDLHTLFWLGKYLYRPETADDLVRHGLFTRSELARFRRSEDFLSAVRCHLHFLAGRADERLTFERQPELARRLGYRDRPGQRAVERFMKHYFLIAKHVGDLTRIVCAALEEREVTRPPVLSRVLGSIGLEKPKEIEHGFAEERGRLTLSDQRAFERDPVNLIRMFHIMNRDGLLLHPFAVQRAARSLSLIDDALRHNAEANRLFLEVLTAKRRPEGTLQRMNEVGVLGRFVPEFGRVVSMMQFSLYHHFTVDEHLLRTVGFVSEIEMGRLEEAHPLSHELIGTLENRRALYVAAFLHDIAKGRREDHSVAGAAIARELCPRLGMSKSETETVAWLVLHHLAMSDVAQRRDLFDPKTISDFAALVQGPERLKLLLILTVADIRAVGPGVWNGWKGELLRTLYYETEPVLAGGHTTAGRGQRVAAAQEALHAQLANWSEDEIARHTARLADPYWLTSDTETQLAHAHLIRAAETADEKFRAAWDTDAFRGATRLMVYTPDHPRLLSTIAGACAVAGANIVGAQITTSHDGFALDTIMLTRDLQTDEDELRRAARIARTIERALRGEMRLTDAIQRRERPAPRLEAFDVEPQVSVNNTLSNHFTVIEVAGRDRPGLLFDLTRTLSALNLNIRSAHVVTFGERAVDVFYVRDLFGHRIHSESRQARICEMMTAVLDPDAPAPKDTGGGIPAAPTAPRRVRA